VKYSFWTAEFGSWANDARVVFRVRDGRRAADRLTEKGISGYDRLRPATEEEIEAWKADHPTLD
jgi:hypothetical protein